MTYSFVLSFTLHIFIFVLIFSHIFFQRSLTFKEDTGLVVNFVKVDKVSRAPILAPLPVIKKVEVKKEKTIERKEEKKEDKKPVVEKEIETKVKEKKDDEPREKIKLNYKKTKAGSLSKQMKLPEKKEKGKTGKEISNSNLQGQRAQEIGDVVTASDISLIKQRVKESWNIPAALSECDIGVLVHITLNRQGKILNVIIEESNPTDDPDLYMLLINSVRALLNNSDLDFSYLSDETLRFLSRPGTTLDLIFNPKDVL